jgi:thymidylate synthase
MMTIRCESLDDALSRLYPQILACEPTEAGSRLGGVTKELLGATIVIEKPRARISRSENRGKPFSALGELLWYLARSDKLDFIRPYVKRYEEETEDGDTVHGAYGPRLFAMRGNINQIENVTSLLRARPGSRRAVIQLFAAEDIDRHFKEIPCTTTLQFLLRSDRLNMSVTMRSNDAYWGLPHDVFCFTMLQEMMARRLGVDVGHYLHYVGSMHIYKDHFEDAQAYLDEGHQKAVEMPPMPEGDPFDLIPRLLDAESQVRGGRPLGAADVFADPYWADILRLLQVYHATGQPALLDKLAAEFEHDIYRTYLEGRREMKRRRPDNPRQPRMNFWGPDDVA